jgi:hypothetical protein
MIHSILGNGEVAQAIKPNLTHSVKIYNIGEWETLRKECIILHVCIPYSAEFTKIVNKAVKCLGPEFVIIHSTVKPGTTKSLSYQKSLYSPVMGRHNDNFPENIKSYTKYFAGDMEDFKSIEHWFSIPISYWGENKSELEFAKVMSTGYMYWNLIFQKMLFQECDERAFDFSKVYKRWNENYNTGLKYKHSDWQRPIYDYDPNPIPGGHCLDANIFLDKNPINDFLKKWQNQHQKAI